LIKTLTRLSPLFPSIQPLFEKAEHLREEGTYLRNMIEHADKNVAAQKKGTPRGGFVRKSNLLPELPGSRSGTVDATSVLIDQNGHWLGGRLNVERAIAEVRTIYQAALKIPAPASRANAPTPPEPPLPIRLFECLDILTGGDKAAAIAWLTTLTQSSAVSRGRRRGEVSRVLAEVVAYLEAQISRKNEGDAQKPDLKGS
jgi:hypothetical protein